MVWTVTQLQRVAVRFRCLQRESVHFCFARLGFLLTQTQRFIIHLHCDVFWKQVVSLSEASLSAVKSIKCGHTLSFEFECLSTIFGSYWVFD